MHLPASSVLRTVSAQRKASEDQSLRPLISYQTMSDRVATVAGRRRPTDPAPHLVYGVGGGARVGVSVVTIVPRYTNSPWPVAMSACGSTFRTLRQTSSSNS